MRDLLFRELPPLQDLSLLPRDAGFAFIDLRPEGNLEPGYKFLICGWDICVGKQFPFPAPVPHPIVFTIDNPRAILSASEFADRFGTGT